MTYAHTVQPRRGLFFSGLFANYLEMKADIFRRKLVAQTARHLEKLTDSQLNDIGIPREEINQRAYEIIYHGEPYRR